jgi:hypothetical protein
MSRNTATTYNGSAPLLTVVDVVRCRSIQYAHGAIFLDPVIAKLDRLARNVHFISGLLESNVMFVAADQPTKDRFMLRL